MSIDKNTFTLYILHAAEKGSKHITHKLVLKSFPKGKVELPFLITKDQDLLVKEGEQGSLEVTLTPVAE